MILAVSVPALVVYFWLMLPAAADGVGTISVNGSDIPVYYIQSTNLSTLNDQFDAANSSVGGLYVPRSFDNETWGVYVAADLSRSSVLYLVSHEIDHHWYRNTNLSVPEQQRIIQRKYHVTVAGIYLGRHKFWNWQPAVLQVVDDI